MVVWGGEILALALLCIYVCASQLGYELIIGDWAVEMKKEPDSELKELRKE